MRDHDVYTFRDRYSEPSDLFKKALSTITHDNEIEDLYRRYSIDDLSYTTNDSNSVLHISLSGHHNSSAFEASVYIKKSRSRRYDYQRTPPPTGLVRYDCDCHDGHEQTDCIHTRAVVAIYASCLYPNIAPEIFRWQDWIEANGNDVATERLPRCVVKLTKSKQEFFVRASIHYYRLKASEEAILRLLDKRVELDGAPGATVLHYLASQQLALTFRKTDLMPHPTRAIPVSFKWTEKDGHLTLRKTLPTKVDIIPTDPPYYINLVDEIYGLADLQPGVLAALHKIKTLGNIRTRDAKAFSIALAKADFTLPLPDNTVKVVTEKVRPYVEVKFGGGGSRKNKKATVQVSVDYDQLNGLQHSDYCEQTDTVTRFVDDTQFVEGIQKQLPAFGDSHLSTTGTTSPLELSAAQAETLKRNLESMVTASAGHMEVNTAEEYPVVLHTYSGDLDIDANLTAGSNLINFTPGITLNGKRVNLLRPTLDLLDSIDDERDFKAFIATLPDKILLNIDNITAVEMPASVMKPLLEFIYQYAASKNDIRITRFEAKALFELQAALEDQVGRFYLDPTVDKTKEFFVTLQKNKGLPPVALPDDFVGELEPYQQVGIDWLCFLSRFNFGAMLADDMGAGKTRQLIGYMSTLSKQLPADPLPRFLVISPVNPTKDWLDEIERCYPALNPYLHHGYNRAKSKETIQHHELIVTTYGTFMNDDFLRTDFVWDTVILDEIQDANNASTDAFKAISQLKARMFIGSSGTPMENTLEELRAVMDLINPGYLGTKGYYNRVYTKPIVEDGCVDTLHTLRRKIGPFILRRRDGDDGVHFDVPDNSIEDVFFELEGTHLQHYEEVRIAGHRDVLRRLKQTGVLKGSINTLPSLTDMRRICCDLRMAKDYVPGEAYSNAKLNYTVDRLDALSKNNEKALVFTYFADSMQIISEALDALNIDHVCIDGSDSRPQRDRKKSQFLDHKTDHIIATLGCMNSGANLQNAHEVIIYDPWYNPHKEIQAIKRAHRKGLQHSLRTRRLLFKDTVEMGIVAIREKKKALFDAVMEEDINYLVSGGITTEDLDIIFRSPVS